MRLAAITAWLLIPLVMGRTLALIQQWQNDLMERGTSGIDFSFLK